MDDDKVQIVTHDVIVRSSKSDPSSRCDISPRNVCHVLFHTLSPTQGHGYRGVRDNGP